jgi:translation elongation factor EF-Ts
VFYVCCAVCFTACRLAAEGGIVAYIHPGSRLGVLLEVNCETDFVAAGDVFNKLANTLAMQIAANPSLEYVSSDEVPAEVLAREKEIEMGREDLQSKPEAIRAKIAEGRVKKLAQVRCVAIHCCCWTLLLLQQTAEPARCRQWLYAAPHQHQRSTGH